MALKPRPLFDKMGEAKIIIDEVVLRCRKDFWPPEMTHKGELLNPKIYAEDMPLSDIVAHCLIEAYESKMGLICMVKHLFDVLEEYALQDSLN